MTDFAVESDFLPARLGVSGRLEDGQLVLDVTPSPHTMVHGMVRVSVLAYAVDSVAGISTDTDPDSWSMTSDLSVRMLAIPAPQRVSASNTIVRSGRRSSTSLVHLSDETGRTVGSGTLGFVRFPRREGDPPKPLITPEQVPDLVGRLNPIDRPLREAAGIEVIDAASGVVQLPVKPELRNPAGTLQGAMVALVAECAVEELLATRHGVEVIVTDLDVRYLAQAPVGPVRSRCEVLGDSPDSPVLVELTDISENRVTTLVYARAAVVQ